MLRLPVPNCGSSASVVQLRRTGRARSRPWPCRILLLQRFEKQFHLPAVFIDGRHRRRPQLVVVGQKHQAPLLGIVDLHPPKKIFLAGLGLAGEKDHFVGDHVAVLGHCPLLHHFIDRVVLQPRHKVHFLPAEVDKPLVIDVAAVEQPAPRQARSAAGAPPADHAFCPW